MDEKAKFKNMVWEQSKYDKLIRDEYIRLLANYYSFDVDNDKYDSSNIDYLDIVLKFYQRYNKDYYHLIRLGLSTHNIIISSDAPGSYTLPSQGISYVKLNGNDRDLFVMIHELAHYIDIKSHPHIINYQRWGYSEVVPYYVERLFERDYADSLQKIIRVRKAKKIISSKRMLRLILIMLKYEEHYKQYGCIDDIINLDEVKELLDEKNNNLINNLLKYPLALLYSAYMMVYGINLQENLDKILDRIPFEDVLKDKKVKELVMYEM